MTTKQARIGTCPNVPMFVVVLMFLRAFDGFKVLELPYKQGERQVSAFLHGLHFSSNLEASKILKDFELVMMHFTRNLTEMFESKMLQKSCVEVNEGGTEAAVVAATILTRSCLSRPHQIKIYWCSICLHADLLSVVFMTRELRMKTKQARRV
ncbi:unnamed protein product [Prunus armeniaca]|uniref:Uncharacterized protein n=1 Tax=Prunus armeniaca TaxID=36596 RepID=A0A6J5US15_PRUAR|nr:unnamed protein product [Prunus armeniaca]